MSVAELKENRASLTAKVNAAIEKAEKIHNIAMRENRTLTSSEQKEFDSAMNEAEELRGEQRRNDTLISNAEALNARKIESMQQSGIGSGSGETPVHASRWTLADGSPVRVVARGEKFARHANSGIGAGDIIRAKISGNERMLRELRNLQSGDVDSAGGFMIPHTVAGQVIDLARANSALVAAGVPFVEMTSDQMTMARVSSDPTFATKTAGNALSESSVGFDAVGFTARTIGCYIRLSRELVQDAPNASELIEQTMARALAAELDRQGINGDGSAEEYGLLVYTGISETTSVGAIAWEDVHTAATGVRAANCEPSAYIVHPEIGGDLDILTASGSGNWLGNPPSLNTVPRLTSTNCPTSGAVVGDFVRGCAFAIRASATVETTAVGGDAFKYHELWLKITWRGCFRVLQPGCFHRLLGITT